MNVAQRLALMSASQHATWNRIVREKLQDCSKLFCGQCPFCLMNCASLQIHCLDTLRAHGHNSNYLSEYPAAIFEAVRLGYLDYVKGVGPVVVEDN